MAVRDTAMMRRLAYSVMSANSENVSGKGVQQTLCDNHYSSHFDPLPTFQNNTVAHGLLFGMRSGSLYATKIQRLWDSNRVLINIWN
jgi:hypothetical protein